MKRLFLLLTFIISISTFSQKKILDHSDFEIWNTIENSAISNNGEFVIYSLEKGEKDNHLKIKDGKSNLIFEHERSESGKFTYDSKFALFSIKAWKDSISELKRRKTKKAKMPKDTLGIFNLKTKEVEKISNVKSYKIPPKWSGYVAYLLEDIQTENKIKKTKKVSKDNGYHLVLRNLSSKAQDTFKYVTNYTFAKEGKKLAFITTGQDSIQKAGVYVYDLSKNNLTQIYQTEKAKYYQLNFSDSGDNLGFVVDTDTTKIQIRSYQLYHWNSSKTEAEKLVDDYSAPKGYLVSSDGRITFSKDDSKLYFGLRTPPIMKDTTLLKEEIVNVEVWTYNEPRLYTVQELQEKNDRKKSYQAVYHLNAKRLVQLSSTEYPSIRLGDEGNALVALVSNPVPYQLESQWTGNRASDISIVNVNTGERREILNKSNFMQLSPKAKYAYGYERADSTWVVYGINSNNKLELTKGRVFYNELNDTPNHPGSYGIAGWSTNDEHVLLYDRYDIWKFDTNTGNSERLTNGRESKITYRYIKLDNEERNIDLDSKWILSTFNEANKYGGAVQFDPKSNKYKELVYGPYSYGSLKKAKYSDDLIFTRQNFEEFPNLHFTDLSFKNQLQISNANPQQKEYNWGTSELVNWTSLDGIELTGMLVKPENFDPNKKYPMIVNFYEKSSNGLHRHRAPSPGRSTINYSFYASRGYIIFNPDVYYREGYPGESAYNCVIPGVTSLIEKGFVDKDNIGVQGHSWGGYQIAYLTTRTDIFKAAESGAPVVNMISAYGGIRWWTGLSRQFQYEHTQSRIGGTPWEYPQRYVENSPVFTLDKVNTPILIMHNDGDGAVPWYQGIEYFVNLRRLGKPVWLLNYNGARHWPLKLQNRKDFNIRMQQFFDHYLQGTPKPVWMERGVPAIEKGINQGYELIKNN